MASIFRTNLARAAAQAIQAHTGHVVAQRHIDAYVTLTAYPASLAKAVDFLSMPVADLTERDQRDMERLAGEAFMAQGR